MKETYSEGGVETPTKTDREVERGRSGKKKKKKIE
jgi:hypothetical protein